MHCHGCESVINNKDFLKCNNCASEYCYACLNITAESRKQLSAKKLASLSCPCCQNVTRRKNDDDTPIKRQLNDTMNVSFTQVSQTELSMNASTGLNLTHQPVTMESIGRLFDLKLSPDSAFMTNLRMTLKKDMEEMVALEVNRAFEKVKVDFTTSTDLMLGEQKDIKQKIIEKDNRIKLLETDLSKSREAISKLQNRLITVEKISRDLNLEIHEVPESKSEDLVALFKKLCECLQVAVCDGDIKMCRRVAKMNSDSKRPRNILVTLSSQRLRDELLSATTRFNKAHPNDKLSLSDMGFTNSKSRVFLAEHLSPEAKELHSMARKFCKDKNFKFVWVRFGQVYIRKDEKSPAVLIKSSETFVNLRCE